MEGDLDAGSAEALEDLAYLARSANRVDLLDALTDRPSTRGELSEREGIARTTVDRIVNELEARDWVRRTNSGAYSATPVGEQVVAEFTPLVETMTVVRELGETVAWFQAVEEPIDLHRLRDATVWRPEPADPMAPTAAYMDDLRSASVFYCLVGVAPPESFEQAMRDGAVERGMDVEHVISESEYRYLLDRPDRLPRWREYVDAGANVYRYAGTVPCNFMIFDETAYIAKTQSEYGEPYTVIESDDDAVVGWARAVIEGYRDDAERLDSGAFRVEAS